MSLSPSSVVSPTVLPITCIEKQFSLKRRLLIVLGGMLVAFLTAGIIYGHSALVPVYIKEGIYGELCQNGNSDFGCEEQRQKLNLIFTIGSSINNIGSFFFGIFLDKYGPRATGTIGSVLLGLGCLLFAISTPGVFEPYLWVYAFIGLSGPCMFLSMIHLVSVFPKRSGLIMSIFSGAFDASCVIFYFFRLVYEATSGSVSLENIFGFYIGVALISLLLFWTLFPKYTLKTMNGLETQPLISPSEGSVDSDNDAHPNPTSNNLSRKTKPFQKMLTMSAIEQMRTALYIGNMLFLCIMMLRVNFFIGTVKDQMHSLFPDSKNRGVIDSLAEAFDILLPLGGVVITPFSGWILDNLSHSTSFFIVIATSVACSVLSMIPNEFCMYAAIFIFVLMRPFLYSAYNDFAAKIYGFETFGMTVGSMLIISGTFTSLQYPLTYLTNSVMGGSFTLANGILLVANLLALAFPCYIKFNGA